MEPRKFSQPLHTTSSNYDLHIHRNNSILQLPLLHNSHIWTHNRVTLYLPDTCNQATFHAWHATAFHFMDAHTFLVLLDTWVVAAAAVAASVFCGDGVFSVVASSLPLLLLLLLVPPGGRVFEGTATGDDAAGGTGASCLLLPEERGADVLVQPPLPEGITVRDLGFLHPYTTTPLSYVVTFYII